jgi:hypothetical protein
VIHLPSITDATVLLVSIPLDRDCSHAPALAHLPDATTAASRLRSICLSTIAVLLWRPRLNSGRSA